VPEC